MRYYIYARVSTEEQDTKNQVYKCWDQIKSVDKTALFPEIFSEEISSRKPISGRKALTDMIARLKKGDVVYIYKLDRIARDIVEMPKIYRMITDKGATLKSVCEPYLEEWMLGLFASFAQKEREDISGRIKTGLQARRSRGERVGRIPFGYRLEHPNLRRTRENAAEPIKLIQCDEEQETLAYMQTLRAANFGYRRIANLLNSEGYLNRGKKWLHSSIWLIMNREGL